MDERKAKELVSSFNWMMVWKQLEQYYTSIRVSLSDEKDEDEMFPGI